MRKMYRPIAGVLAAGALISVAACGSSAAATSASDSPSPAAGTASGANAAAAQPAVPKAAFEQLTGDGTSVTLDPGTLGVLQKYGVAVAPVAPAVVAKSGNDTNVTFPITSGFVSLYDTSQLPFIRGTFTHSGGVTFSAGGKSLTATDFVVNPGTSTLTATVGGAAVPLLDINGSNLKVSMDGGKVHIDGPVASLSKAAAGALNQTFGVDVFKQGIPLGVVHIVATGKASPGGSPAAEIMSLGGTSTSVTLDAATAGVLTTNGVSVAPVAPATFASGVVTFPISAGYAAVYPNAVPNVRGTISHTGGITFSAGSKSLTATDFMVNPGTSTLTATVGGNAVPLLDLDGSKFQMSKDAQGNVVLDGIVAKLSQPAADALNMTFGVSLFKQGIVIGAVHLVATPTAG